MHRRLYLVALLLVLLSAGLAAPHAAHAAGITATLSGCTYVFSGNIGSGPTTGIAIVVDIDAPPPAFVGTGVFNVDAAGNVSGTVPFNAPSGHRIVVSPPAAKIDIAPSCGPGGGQFFNPGDGRINPQPGDRIAVYCNNTRPPTIGIYGIDPQGRGIFLTQALVSDIL